LRPFIDCERPQVNATEA